MSDSKDEKLLTAMGVVTEALPSTLFRVKIEDKNQDKTEEEKEILAFKPEPYWQVSLLVKNSSEFIVKYAKNITSRIKNLEFRHIDLNGKYSIPSCEAYLINDVLHHIPDKSKKWILKSVFSSMPYNGVLVIKDMSFRSKIKFFLNYLNDIIMTRNDKLYFISRERLTKMLQDIGFKIKAKELKGYAFPHIIYTCRKIT